MSAFEKLKWEHSIQLVLAQELSRLTSKKDLPCKVELFDLRTKLASSLIRHLMEEDWVVYPSLLRSPDPCVQDAVRTLRLESGMLADAFRAYMKRWTTVAIELDWSTYCKETSILLRALTRRMSREDLSLYGEVSVNSEPDLPSAACWG